MFEINTLNSRPTYDPAMVMPMREEVTRIGIRELLTPDEVDAALQTKGTAMVFVNSVCGCAAGSARPGLAMAMQNPVRPDKLYSVFAGMEKDAVAKARGYFTGYAPSSPSIALLKDGKIVAMIERYQIEGRPPQMVAGMVAAMFNAHCAEPQA